MAIKTFVGTIRNWGISSNSRIEGRFADGQHPKALTNGVVPGCIIVTSTVLKFEDRGGYHEVETLNSRYVLLGDAQYDHRPEAH